MKNKVYCYYKDNKGIWKPATQERFDGSIIVWKMFPFKQGNSWGFQGERICYKNSDELWRMFRIYLDYKKSKTSGQVCVNINGKDAKIIFGSGLSCEELNKQETCSNCKASSKSQLYSEQLNCEKTGMFVNKNQKACSHIQKKYEVEWKPYKGIDNLYTPDKDFYSEKSYKYEVKLKNGSKIFVTYEDIWEDYYTGFQDQFDTRHDRLFKDKDDNIIDDKDFMQYRLVENNNLPKCPYKDYAESCCNNCSFKNKPGCREKEWNKIQEQWQEDAYNEERMRQEAYEDAMRDELMRSNYDADYGDVKY